MTQEWTELKTAREQYMKWAKECGYQHPDAIGTCEDFAYFDLEALCQRVWNEAIEEAATKCEVIHSRHSTNYNTAVSYCVKVIRELKVEP